MKYLRDCQIDNASRCVRVILNESRISDCCIEMVLEEHLIEYVNITKLHLISFT